MPRYITIPANTSITIGRNPDTSPATVEIVFVTLMLEGWTLSPKFAANLVEIERGSRIRNAFRGKKPGDVIVLDEADWAPLNTILNTEQPLNPAIVPLVYEARPEMFTCISKAPTEDPRTKLVDGAALAAATS